MREKLIIISQYNAKENFINTQARAFNNTTVMDIIKNTCKDAVDRF